MTVDHFLELFTAVLRGENTSWPAESDQTFIDAFLAAADRRGLKPLLHYALTQAGNPHQCPGPLRERLTEKARMEAVAGVRRDEACRRVIATLAANSVQALVLKGAAISYSHYPYPGLRPRDDTDLLIPEERVEITGRLMERLGYSKLTGTSGDLVSRQMCYAPRENSRFPHFFDIHWRISNRPGFAETFSFQELRERAAPLLPLGPHALGLEPADALILACIHRANHSPSERRLMWLYDIHLLADAMDNDQFSRFARRAEEKAVRAICRHELLEARVYFRTRLPGATLDKWFSPEEIRGEEAVGRGYPHPTRGLDRMVADFQALPNWRKRLKLLKEHVFPSPGYMLKRFNAPTPLLLPFLYLYRALRGAVKLLRKY